MTAAPSVLDLSPVISKLTADLRTATKTLNPREARYMVDTYYAMQDARIRAAGQNRAMGESGEPSTVFGWLQQQSEALENRVKSLLDAYSDSQVIGRWSRSICGIGPVIAAGLMAHIDIDKAPTPGHIYSFAGLDPNQKWLGASATELVKTAFANASTPGHALTSLAVVSGRRPFEICKLSDPLFQVPDADTVAKALHEASDGAVDPQTITDLCRSVIYQDNAIRTICKRSGANESSVYDALLPALDLHRTEITQAMKRRPWNATLKVLCWKLGESFVKTCNNERSFYGPLYIARKEYESKLNADGKLKDQAEAVLAKKKIGKTTEAYKHYSEGHLPPAHIHARACRWTVKMFLAHWHQRAWEAKHPGETYSCVPYPIAHLNHMHKIEPPPAVD